jgi:microcystin-dependent protein
MEPYIGEIRAVGFNFAPVGWLSCNGQTVSIADYEILYSLIGTTYGGDGVQNFNLPNFQSRLGVGSQQGAAGPGLTSYPLGVWEGQENVTLNTNQLAAHQHPFTTQLTGNTGGSPGTNPNSNYPGSSQTNPYAGSSTGQTLQAGAAVFNMAPAGGTQPHTNIQPALALNYIISTEGIYPPRS